MCRNFGSSKGLRPDILAPVLGTPQLSAPCKSFSPISVLPRWQGLGVLTCYYLVAQIATEGDGAAYVPFSAGVIGAKGDDLMLVQTMKRAFDMADWRIHVDTGRLTYPVGDNPRSVDDHHQDPSPPPIPGGVSFAVDDTTDPEL